MNSETKNADQAYSDQLSEFEEQLRHTMDDQSLLQDVHRAIRELLKESQDSESDIREILQDRLDSGTLREESYQLVRQMLDRIVSGDEEALPATIESKSFVETAVYKQDFGETDVIATSSSEKAVREDHLQVGSVLRDRFLLQQRLSGGSMGVVFKAMDRRLAEADGGGDPSVAIKVLSPKLSRNGNALRALQQEAVKGRCLSHPNIVRFLDLDRDDELYFIVMEWLEGRSLADILDGSKSKTIDIEMAVDILKQIGSALSYAHRCGVVHADVKPGNVIITPSGTVKLFDFGVARIKQKQSDTPSKFDPAVLGATTPAYSSMQVLTGEEPTPADDVFSLACLFYRLVAGYRVFGPRNAAEAAESGMEPQQPHGLSESQWKVLKKALAYSRVARYSSTEEFVSSITSAEIDVSTPVVIGEPVSHEPDETSTRRSPIVVGMFLIVAGLIYLGTETDLISKYMPSAGPVINGAPTPDEQSTLEPDDIIEEPAEETMSTDTQDATESAIDTSTANSEFSEPAAPLDEAGTGDSLDPAPAENSPDLTDDTEEFSLDDIFVDDDPLVSSAPPAESTVAGDYPAEEPVWLLATHALNLAPVGSARSELSITLREDQAPAVIDLYRSDGIETSQTVRIAEVGFSGNQSPWSAGAYEIADNGVVEFSANQNRAQTTIVVTSNTLSQPDRQASLLIRVSDAPESELALISLNIEDDDRRNFEENLPANTIAFSDAQVVVRESDPAVQIDVLRFNPDDQAVEVDYLVSDISANEGEDYFAPGVTSISFLPNQRMVRLLIPLVQDSALESDETFVIEIVSGATIAEGNINRRIAVIITDDDSGIQ